MALGANVLNISNATYCTNVDKNLQSVAQF